MIRTAVCDDSVVFAEKAAETARNFNFEVSIYGNAEELAADMESKKFDIYILDIEMPGESGLELAKTINSSGDGIIILLSNHDKYVFEGYKVRALRFVRKSNMQPELEEALTAAEKLLESSNRQIVLELESGITRKIGIKDIVMMEKYGKYVFFHLSGGETGKERISLAEAEKRISSSDFITVRKGVIVNAGHIKFMDGAELTMDNGQKCYISREKIRSVKEKILEFWGK